jgi:hypothetical protein
MTLDNLQELLDSKVSEIGSSDLSQKNRFALLFEISEIAGKIDTAAIDHPNESVIKTKTDASVGQALKIYEICDTKERFDRDIPSHVRSIIKKTKI